MDKKTKRMLELLDGLVQKCDLCGLNINGRAKPYWSEKSKYMIISESPNKDDIKNNDVLTGGVGEMFWDIMAQYHWLKEDFIVLNSVNCKVNGKPSEYHRECCMKWIKKYIQIIQPQKILLMGNYALHTINNEWGIENFYKNNRLKTSKKLFGIDTQIIKSYNPNSVLYNSKRKNGLIRSIKLLKD